MMKGVVVVIDKATSNPALKAAWLASEQFGKAISGGGITLPRTIEKQEENVMTTSGDDRFVGERLRENYFIGGESEMKAYSSSCVSRTFVSFTGLDDLNKTLGT